MDLTCTGHKNFTLNGFSLIAFSQMRDFSSVIIVGVLLMYLLSLVGNFLIITIVCAASHLHTPMYFFLVNLSAQDIIYVTGTLPKLLAIQMTGDTTISFPGCITQMFVFAACLDTEFFLLASMALDRYVAICIPLRYSLIMSKTVYISLAFTSWTIGFLNSLMYTILISKLSFCDLKNINHFYCDIKALLRLSFSDIRHINMAIFIEGGVLGFLPFTMILTSYGFIISAITKIQTLEGRRKTFSNCSSHLTVVLLFCGTSLGLYMKPESKSSLEQDKILALLYIAVVPALNPLVYSLRNREVLRVLRLCKDNFLFSN